MGNDGGEVKQPFWKGLLMLNSEGSAGGQSASSLKLRVSRLLLLGGLTLILVSMFGLMIGAGSTLAAQLFNQSQPTEVAAVTSTATFTPSPTATATNTPTVIEQTASSILEKFLDLMARLEVDGAMLRSGPGIEYMAVSDELDAGSMVKVLYVETSQTWLLVEIEDDLQGWLSIEWLSLDFDITTAAVLDVPTATPIPTRTKTPLPTSTQKVPAVTSTPTKPPAPLPSTATKLPPPPLATETKPPPAATETKPPAPATPTEPAYP